MTYVEAPRPINPAVYMPEHGYDSRWAGSDLQQMPHHESLQLLNGTIAQYIEALNQGNYHVENIGPEAQRLTDHVLTFEQHVTEFAPEAGEHITQRYAEVDKLTEGLSAQERMTARILSAPEGVLFISDMDDTQSEGSAGYLPLIPGSEHAEPMLAQQGREAFARVFASTWAPLLRAAPEAFAQAGQHIDLRPGSQELYEMAHDNGIPYTILSANFKPLVEAVAAKIAANRSINKDQIIAITPDSICATAKHVVIEMIAKMNPDRAVIYLGDGSSDKESIKASQYVAAYYALEDAGFAAELRKEGVPHGEFRDMFDIIDSLQTIGALPSARVQMAA